MRTDVSPRPAWIGRPGLWLFGGLLALGAPCRAAEALPEPLKRHDVIVFAGDSLTEKGCEPDGFVTLVAADMDRRFASLGIQVQGAGQGWDTVGKLRQRFDGHVMARKPTVVIIQIGGNDVCQEGAERTTAKEIFRLGLEDVIWRVRRARARPVLCTIHVLGERTDGGNRYDALIEEYSEIQRAVAAAKGCQLIDLRRRFMEYLRANNPANAANGVLTTDGAHLNAAGNRFLADIMVHALTSTQRIVSASAPLPPAASPAMPGSPHP